jgi:nucleoid-associated protein YgaU
MKLKEKYDPVLKLGESFEIRDGYVDESDNILKIGGMARYQYEKDRLWDEIKSIGGEEPSDIEADIKVENKDVYAMHTVEKGETLGKIAKKYYGKPSKYKEIYEANSDILDNPDLIHPGQELKIPFSSE